MRYRIIALLLFTTSPLWAYECTGPIDPVCNDQGKTCEFEALFGTYQCQDPSCSVIGCLDGNCNGNDCKKSQDCTTFPWPTCPLNGTTGSCNFFPFSNFSQTVISFYPGKCGSCQYTYGFNCSQPQQKCSHDFDATTASSMCFPQNNNLCCECMRGGVMKKSGGACDVAGSGCLAPGPCALPSPPPPSSPPLPPPPPSPPPPPPPYVSPCGSNKLCGKITSYEDPSIVLSNVPMTLRDSVGKIARSTVTDQTGNYIFTGYPDGQYYINAEAGRNESATPAEIPRQMQSNQAAAANFRILGTPARLTIKALPGTFVVVSTFAVTGSPPAFKLGSITLFYSTVIDKEMKGNLEVAASASLWMACYIPHVTPQERYYAKSENMQLPIVKPLDTLSLECPQ